MEPNVKIIANKQFWLNSQDFLRGAAVAAFSGPLYAIIDGLSQPHFEINWVILLKGALGGFLAYIAKNFFTPTNTTIQVNQPSSKKQVEGDIPPPAQITVDMKPGEKPTVTTSIG